MKLISVISFLATIAGLGWYSADLEQRNPETLFLTQTGLEEYKRFQDKIPDRKILAIKIDYQEDVNFSEYLGLKKKLQPLISSYEEKIDFLLPEDTQLGPERFERFLATGAHKQKIKSSLNLVRAKTFSFLMIEKSTEAIGEPEIRELQKVLAEFDHVKIAGTPYTNFLLDQYARSIKKSLFPIMYAFAFLIIFLVTRNLFTTLVLFFPCLMASIVSLALMKSFHGTMNMVTSIVPLMVFTINLSLVFHIYFSVVKLGSFSRALDLKLKPTALMVITTFVGFASLLVSEIQVIRDFGACSSFLIVLSAMLTVFWLATCEKMLVKNGKGTALALPGFLQNKKSLPLRLIYLFSAVAVVGGIYAVQEIKILTDATQYFPPSAKIKESMDEVNREVAGLPIFEVIIELDRPLYKELLNLRGLEKALAGLVDKNQMELKLLSLNRLTEELARQASGGELDEEELTESMQEEDFLTDMQALLKPSLREAFPIGSFYKLSFLGQAVNVDEFLKQLKVIEGALGESNYAKNYEINGLYYNLMRAQKAMIDVLTKSFILALLVVSLISYIFLRKLRVFFIFLLINTIPVFLSFIAMRALGLSINIATVMTYSIGLGIIVDSSFHLVHALDDIESGFQHYYKTTVLPIIGSSILLIFCFGIFGWNSFLPIREFGLNLAVILFFGMIFDLYILPSLYLGDHRLEQYFEARSVQ